MPPVPPEQTSPYGSPALSAVELRRLITLKRAAELTTLSIDSLKRNHADKIRQLGPRRQAMTLGDALAIGAPES